MKKPANDSGLFHLYSTYRISQIKSIHFVVLVRHQYKDEMDGMCKKLWLSDRRNRTKQDHHLLTWELMWRHPAIYLYTWILQHILLSSMERMVKSQ
jgi:hypothetical protein